VVIGKFELLMDPEEEKAAVLKPDEFKLLLHLASFGRNGKRNIAIVWMSFGSALRVTEIARLKVRDVVDPDGELKDEFRLPSAYTKNGESRMAYMLEPEHKKALFDYLDWRSENRRRINDSSEFRGLIPDSPLFLARGNAGFAFRKKEYQKADGTVAEYSVCSSMQQLLSNLVGKAVDGGSSHSGRRTFATRLADRGVDLDYIKYLLGHKTKQQSLAYIESNTKRLRNILKGIYGDI
jgi:integrase